MSDPRMSDPREAAARYRLEKAESAGEEATEDTTDEASPRSGRTPSWRERAAYVETSIQQAIRRGEFDDLPGTGKPLRGLGEAHDPDWWIKQKIESEGITGLGPPALLLRTEYAQLDARLDEQTREADVREALEDFNRRVIEARRQLLGGPPVVTPLADIEARVEAWQKRRDAAARALTEAQAAAVDSPRSRTWRQRRADRRR